MTAAVGVVGASARAAGGSLRRAGFAAWAVDLFADRDLKRIAPCVRCPFDRYPVALPELAEQFPPGPVLYTGGLENHPDVVRELAARRELWGNPPDVLERARDPFAVSAALTASNLPVPPVRPSLLIPPSGRWLLKPLRSSGGIGVRFANKNEQLRPDCYLQEFIDGPPMSALFVTREVGVLLLGVTAQLIGEPWLHAGAFRYAGNIGPLDVERDLAEQLGSLGATLSHACGLRGLWGIDFILSNGQPYFVEVNPRYTAAVEVIELGIRSPLVRQHVAAFCQQPDWQSGPPFWRQHIGKAIYFAPQRITFPASGPWDADLAGEFDPWRVPDFADIPEVGEVTEPGWPVLTFFAAGSTPDECRERLQSRAAELDQLFATDSQP